MFADADLIRAVLIKVRDLPPQGSDRELSVEGYPQDHTNNCVRVLAQSGMMKAIDASDHDELSLWPQYLTLQGAQFLSEIADDTKWQKTKDLAWSGAGTAAATAAQVAAAQLLARLFGGKQ